MRRAGTCACVVPAVFGLSDSSHHATEGKVLQPARRLVPLVVIHHCHHLRFLRKLYCTFLVTFRETRPYTAAQREEKGEKQPEARKGSGTRHDQASMPARRSGSPGAPRSRHHASQRARSTASRRRASSCAARSRSSSAGASVPPAPAAHSCTPPYASTTSTPAPVHTCAGIHAGASARGRCRRRSPSPLSSLLPPLLPRRRFNRKRRTAAASTPALKARAPARGRERREAGGLPAARGWSMFLFADCSLSAADGAVGAAGCSAGPLDLFSPRSAPPPPPRDASERARLRASRRRAAACSATAAATSRARAPVTGS